MMNLNLEKAAQQILRYLFTSYKRGASVLYPIDAVARKYGADPIELSDFLLKQEWIRERWIYSGNVVACRITIAGIEKIDPLYVQTKVDLIIGGLAAAAGTKPLLEILEYNIEEFAMVSDFVNQLERLGLVSMSNPDNKIMVELTPAGRKYHEGMGGSSTRLMAIA